MFVNAKCHKIVVFFAEVMWLFAPSNDKCVIYAKQCVAAKGGTLTCSSSLTKPMLSQDSGACGPLLDSHITCMIMTFTHTVIYLWFNSHYNYSYCGFSVSHKESEIQYNISIIIIIYNIIYIYIYIFFLFFAWGGGMCPQSHCMDSYVFCNLMIAREWFQSQTQTCKYRKCFFEAWTNK